MRFCSKSGITRGFARQSEIILYFHDTGASKKPLLRLKQGTFLGLEIYNWGESGPISPSSRVSDCGLTFLYALYTFLNHATLNS